MFLRIIAQFAVQSKNSIIFWQMNEKKKEKFKLLKLWQFHRERMNERTLYICINIQYGSYECVLTIHIHIFRCHVVQLIIHVQFVPIEMRSCKHSVQIGSNNFVFFFFNFSLSFLHNIVSLAEINFYGFWSSSSPNWPLFGNHLSSSNNPYIINRPTI